MSKAQANPEKKRSKIQQTDLPNMSLEQAMRIPEALWENFAGKDAAPHSIAMSVEMSPTSGTWRNLCGAAAAYGLTDGGYNASRIVLSSVGRRAVAPTEEGDNFAALQEAALLPKIARAFFDRYNRAKFPRTEIAENVLIEFGIPKDRAKSAVDLLRSNGEFVGFIQQTKTGLFVATDAAGSTISRKLDIDRTDSAKREVDAELHDDRENTTASSAESYPMRKETKEENRVFITHGKDTAILDQIAKLVKLGGFEPVISIQRETAAKPVPEKVMDDMRSCGAAVIHVGSEFILFDKDGNEYPQINPNVLIEIGASMALYKGRFILVVEEGIKLPSNLQGMYESRYNGESIALDAGMRILEALRGLKDR